MFKLLNRKNKMKELECRISALESNVGSNTQWISELASKVADRMPGGASEAGGDLVLMVDGSVIGKVALNKLRKMQNKAEIKLGHV